MQPNDYQGLNIQGTGDRFDEWWELEHQEDDVDDVEADDYSEDDLE